MFWGLNLKPNRKYSQTTSKDFHISQASIENGDSKVYLISGNQKFLICTLDNEQSKQFVLDLNFAKGEEVCFQTVGSGNVTLSGYVFDDKSDNEDDDDDDISDSELLKQLKKVGKKMPGGGKEEDDDDDDDDEDDDDEDGDSDAEEGDSELDLDELGEEEEEDDEEEDGNDDEDDSDEEPKKKHSKLDPKQAKQNGVAKKAEAVAATDKKSKKDKKKENKKEAPKGQQQQQQAQTGERSITGGVKIEDIRVGNGPEAKTGKRAQVFYEGRLKSNNKVFDSLKQGSGFKFALGRGEVIKGWDVGVAGMKVGGKRRITCPPHMAYGARGSPPAIPPNSTLVFEVELKGVN